MKLTANTILITGGTSGIGLELATQLQKRNNTVIVTGRDLKKLNEIRERVPKVHIYQSDVSNAEAIPALYQKVIGDFPDLNMLINNAGIMRMVNLNRENGLLDIESEVEINLLGPIRMVKQFLPHIKTKQNAAIVNVSSGLAFLPLASAPIYCATKAGIHSYTQSLRIQLQDTTVKVFELAPPPTNTPLMDNYGSASLNSTSRGVMKVDKMINVVMKGLENDTYEIRPGTSNILNFMSRYAPKFMFRQMNKSVAKELAEMSIDSSEKSKVDTH